MSELDKNKQLKFDVGVAIEVQIIKRGYEELPFGNKYVVHIKETVEGCDYFLPSEGLIKKMEEEGVGDRDIINITKAPADEKFKYGYFTVSTVSKANTEDTGVESIDKGVANFEKQFKSDDKLDMHELVLRIEKLEESVQELKKAQLPF